MRLKRIKLAGFKSFVDPTNIPFPGEMTAIVGPNGCGKSNVIDAVRWVLGESSAKNLRGDAMTDVIFNGSSARKPVGQCSVELVFDNSSNRIGGEYAKYNELSVKRLVTRDAQSFYYLNNTKCRRRDVTDIFLGTGLGPRSYAIIEQGMISRLIESKPQELRVFIEEAAGISKYKERRKETLNRIKHTQENLERLADVRTELGSQIDKLQRQAAAAKRYTELKQRQRTAQHELLAHKWVIQADNIEQAQQEIAKLESELASFEAQSQGDQTHLIQLQEQLHDIQGVITSLQEEKYSLVTKITRLEQDKKYQDERKRQTEQNILQVRTQLDAQAQGFRGLEEQYREAQDILEELAPEVLVYQEQLNEYQSNLATAKDTFASFLRESQASANQYQAIKSQISAKHSQIQTLVSVQFKAQTRLAHLTEQHNTIKTEMAQTQSQVDELTAELDSLEQSVQMCISAKDTASLALAESNAAKELVEHAYQEVASNLQVASVEHATLSAFNQSQNEELPASLVDECLLFSDYFDVEANGAEAVDNWLNVMPTLWVVKCEREVFWSLIKSSHTVPKGHAFCFIDEFVANTKHGLGRYVNNAQVPEYLLTLDEIADTREAFSVNDMLIFSASDAQQGQIARTQKLATLNQLIEQLETQLADLSDERQACDIKVEHDQAKVNDADIQVSQAKNALQVCQQQQQKLHFQSSHQETQIEQLQTQILEAQTNLEQDDEALAVLNEEVAELSLSLEEYGDIHENFGERQTLFETEIEALESSVAQQQSVVHQAELNLQQAQSSAQYLQQTIVSHDEQIKEKQLQLEQLNEILLEITEPAAPDEEVLADLVETQAELEAKIVTQQTQAVDIDEQIKNIEQGTAGYKAQLTLINEKIQSAKLTLEGHNVRAASIVEQLGQHNANLKDIIPSLDRDIEIEFREKELNEIANKIQRLGAVNLAAVDEFAVQSERKAHLDEQFTDLTEALSTLETAMRKIDHETKTRFKATFEQVNNDLKMLFPKVFGGGAAYLELTGDDMLDTGVTIMARPPGKKNSTIHLLSGGEKALTALSLVFAIFRLNPAPFCLLDEVDAPLDDANVGRFCKLVSEMSKTVQFIYISHNKIAMEMASHLTGVTMSEPGVSRMVAVDLEEAVAIVEA